ncbi:uncharacterized protein LOC110049377, partial [Paramuricea clavata]
VPVKRLSNTLTRAIYRRSIKSPNRSVVHSSPWIKEKLFSFKAIEKYLKAFHKSGIRKSVVFCVPLVHSSWRTLDLYTSCHFLQHLSRQFVPHITLFPSDPGSCLNKAKQKSATFTTYTQDKQKAVQLVNIYTQECKAYMGVTGKPNLYATLNENLRSGNPRIVWNDMSALLSKGLVLLGSQVIPNLYRGCHCPVVKKGTPFTFKQFASTTSNPDVALKFLESPAGKSFIHIKKAEGTDVQPYSRFPTEDEFLLGPDINLDVVQVETDINRIHEEIKKISPTADVRKYRTVEKYVVLDGSRKTKKPKGNAHILQGIEEELRLAGEAFLEGDDGCEVSVARNEVKLSMIFKWYKEDFGYDKFEIALWVHDHMGDCQKKKDLGEILLDKNFKLTHMSYNWSLNSK